MPIDFIAASLLVLVILQGLSVLLANLEIAAKHIEGQSTWTAEDGTVFEEISLPELEHSQVMQHEWDVTHTATFPAARLSHANG
jgi:competence protein ComGF